MMNYFYLLLDTINILYLIQFMIDYKLKKKIIFIFLIIHFFITPINKFYFQSTEIGNKIRYFFFNINMNKDNYILCDQQTNYSNNMFDELNFGFFFILISLNVMFIIILIMNLNFYLKNIKRYNNIKLKIIYKIIVNFLKLIKSLYFIYFAINVNKCNSLYYPIVYFIYKILPFIYKILHLFILLLYYFSKSCLFILFKISKIYYM
jgi:hypothetical protein